MAKKKKTETRTLVTIRCIIYTNLILCFNKISNIDDDIIFISIKLNQNVSAFSMCILILYRNGYNSACFWQRCTKYRKRDDWTGWASGVIQFVSVGGKEIVIAGFWKRERGNNTSMIYYIYISCIRTSY